MVGKVIDAGVPRRWAEWFVAEASKKMIHRLVLEMLLVMWARGRTTSYTLSGLIKNLAGHRVGGGIQQPLARPMLVGE
jgi:hypothetical protein